MQKIIALCGVYALLLPVLLMPGWLAAASMSSQCKQIRWEPGRIVEVEAEIFQKTHVALPEAALDIVWGSDELWSIDWVQQHVFIKPTSEHAYGSHTTATIVGNSGNAYQLRIKRVKNMHTHCYVLENKRDSLNHASWSQHGPDARIAQLTRQMAMMQAQAREREAKVKRDAERQAREKIRQLKKDIYSGYKVVRSDGFFAEDGVTSIYDDGRFTYVTLKQDTNGIMAIQGEISEKMQTLEFSYDTANLTYSIVGLFPALVLRHNDSELVIQRKE